MPDLTRTVPAEPVLAALCRSLTARAAVPAAGIYLLMDGRWRLQFASPGPFHGAPEGPVTRALCAALAKRAATRLDPGALDHGGRFCAVHPLAAARGRARGFVAALDARPRRLGQRMSDALADAAAILEPLLGATHDAEAPGSAVIAATAGRLIAAGAAQAPAARPGAQRSIATRLGAGAPRPPLSILMIDIDRFRAISAVLGMTAGSALLTMIGERLEACLGPADLLVRLDGDRFLIVAEVGPDEARRLARRVLGTIGHPLNLNGRSIVTHASIGIAVAGDEDTGPAPLLMNADSALRRAKASGRNRFEMHEPGLDGVLQERSRLELDLQAAVPSGQMRLAYQPYVDLASGDASGVEALLRWRHPLRGDIAPGTFIPLAEATGLILPIGVWALRTACRAATAWPGRLTLSVNISALQFHQRGFVAEVDRALEDSGFPPSRLELEITETVLMRDNPDTIGQLDALIARGIRIALDDFGTGYSALAYLSRLPHHRIKLDRSFVQDLEQPATAELVRAIIAHARASGVAVTAEGVERPEQLNRVARLGFTHAQGFVTGAPVADASRLLEAKPAPA